MFKELLYRGPPLSFEVVLAGLYTVASYSSFYHGWMGTRQPFKLHSFDSPKSCVFYLFVAQRGYGRVSGCGCNSHGFKSLRRSWMDWWCSTITLQLGGKNQEWSGVAASTTSVEVWDLCSSVEIFKLGLWEEPDLWRLSLLYPAQTSHSTDQFANILILQVRVPSTWLRNFLDMFWAKKTRPYCTNTAATICSCAILYCIK